MQVLCQELSRLATPFLPSHRPNLPGFTDSPEGVANLLLGVANLVVSTVIEFLSQVLPGPYFCHFATNAILELQFNHGYYIITYITPNMHFAL